MLIAMPSIRPNYHTDQRQFSLLAFRALTIDELTRARLNLAAAQANFTSQQEYDGFDKL